MSGFIPQIGVRGLYTLLAPFDKDLLANVQYNCIAVRRLSDLVAAGENPKEVFYLNRQLTENEYKADLANEVCIVSLQGGSDHLVQVPSSYISGFPNIGGIAYTNMALAVVLGAIPDALDLSYVTQKVKDVMLENLGLAVEVKQVAISMPMYLSDAEHQAVESARQERINTIVTDYSRYLATMQQLELAQEKIQELEIFIFEKLGPNATLP